MARGKQVYNIIPVPNVNKYVDRPPDFPRMGILYLELLENKDKINPVLINVDHVPKYAAERIHRPENNEDTITEEREINVPKNPYINRDKINRGETAEIKGRDILNEKMNDILGNDSSYTEKGRDEYSDGEYNRKNDRKDHHGYNDKYSPWNNRKNSRKFSDPNSKFSDKYSDSRSERLNHKFNDKYSDSFSENSRERFSDGPRTKFNDRPNDKNGKYSDSRSDKYSYSRSCDSEYSNYSDSYSKESPDLLSKKLKSILAEDSREEHHRDRDRDYHDKYSKQHTSGAPTLNQLEKEGHVFSKELPHLSTLDNKDLNERKREIIFKFELLKKAYKNADIPEYSIHSDLGTMEQSYESIKKNLKIDSSVEQWRMYLAIFFGIVEFVLGNFLNLDVKGFAVHQIGCLDKYNDLLIELGEKSYIPSGSNFPIELRLLFMVLMQSGIFIVVKILSKKVGGIPFMNMGTTENVKKRKMNGPKYNLDDIEDE